jgi:DNA transformation protein
VASSAELLEFLTEQMAGFGPVSRRRMFSGAGFFRDGLMFALVARDVLYFKADAETASHFDAEGLAAFAYETKKGTHTLTTYRKAPEICLEDPDQMVEWCRLAWGAACRGAKPKARRSRQ